VFSIHASPYLVTISARLDHGFEHFDLAEEEAFFAARMSPKVVKEIPSSEVHAGYTARAGDRRPFLSDGKVGWGGWIRTNTGLINSEVPYQLDHAPAAVQF
jgi:hypothetical protein